MKPDKHNVNCGCEGCKVEDKPKCSQERFNYAPPQGYKVDESISWEERFDRVFSFKDFVYEEDFSNHGIPTKLIINLQGIKSFIAKEKELSYKEGYEEGLKDSGVTD